MSGHIIDMVNRMKQNKVSPRKKFKGDNRDVISLAEADQHTEYDFPVVSKEEMQEIKLQIKKTSKENMQMSMYIFVSSFVIVATAFLLFLKYFH